MRGPSRNTMQLESLFYCEKALAIVLAALVLWTGVVEDTSGKDWGHQSITAACVRGRRSSNPGLSHNVTLHHGVPTVAL
ncbi:hypothetical protein HOY82DRAFT_597563 [Tuber indicum]|nr:hypothetical protein HOY82DRAFT_597563 [Tuber indicum]